MKIYIPDYYKEFQCIAGQCKDNCCIGWDIMIDEESYDKYQKVTSDFKDRLNQGIRHGKEPQFYMDEQDRCVFLNKDNLCDIYIELGESALCEICTQHPRFHNEYGHIKQSGLGIACEEAARLIIERSDFSIIEEHNESDDEGIDEWAEEIVCIEMKLFDLLKERECPIEDRINKIFDMAAAYQEELNLTGELVAQLENKCIVPHNILKKMKQKDYLEYWFDFYKELDYMNDEFKMLIQGAKKDLDLESEYHSNDVYIERLINYFIYRHFIKSYEDDNLLDKIKFAILSVLIIEHIDQFCQNHEIPYGFTDVAKMYSKEIEYSQENMESICEELLFE